MEAAILATQELGVDEIWRQIGPRVRLRIDSSFEQRRMTDSEKLKQLVAENWQPDPDLQELCIFIPAVDYLVQACRELCKEVYSICEEARQQANVEESPQSDRAIFFKGIQPKIHAIRTLAANDLQILAPALEDPNSGEYGLPDVDRLNTGLDNVEVEWGVKLGVGLPPYDESSAEPTPALDRYPKSNSLLNGTLP